MVFLLAVCDGRQYHSFLSYIENSVNTSKLCVFGFFNKFSHIDPVGIMLKSDFMKTEQLAQELKGDTHTSSDTFISIKEVLVLAV